MIVQEPVIRLLYTLDPFSRMLHEAHNQHVPPLRKNEEQQLPHHLAARFSCSRTLRNGAYREQLTTLCTQSGTDGSQSSLDYVAIPHEQPLHIHPLGPAARRLLVLRTGRLAGHMDWFAPEGTIVYDTKHGIHGAIDTAHGNTRGAHHRYTLSPYSAYAVEIPGGVHRFRALNILSYHPYDAPKQAASMVPQNAMWTRPFPRTQKTLAHAEPMHVITTVQQLDEVSAGIIEALTGMVREGPNNAADNVMDQFTCRLPTAHRYGDGFIEQVESQRQR